MVIWDSGIENTWNCSEVILMSSAVRMGYGKGDQLMLESVYLCYNLQRLNEMTKVHRNKRAGL